jgi:hypothetical protein
VKSKEKKSKMIPRRNQEASQVWSHLHITFWYSLVLSWRDYLSVRLGQVLLLLGIMQVMPIVVAFCVTSP